MLTFKTSFQWTIIEDTELTRWSYGKNMHENNSNFKPFFTVIPAF